MLTRPVNKDDALEDFASREITLNGIAQGFATDRVVERLRKAGLTTTLVDTTDLDALERAFTPRTKLLWLESPGNPLLSITDIAAAAAIAKKHGALTAIDNTSSLLVNPADQPPAESPQQ